MPKGTFRSIVTDIASGLAGCVLAVCAGAPTRAALPRTQPRVPIDTDNRTLMCWCGRGAKTPTHPLESVTARECNGCNAWEK